jgi:cellulose synthase/poly-beta-1,6-N-acetylglucosamine synthase-like glycosyltransferase
MTILNVMVIACILIQVFFIFQIFHHYKYVLKKFSKKHASYRPKVALIVPCKGIDTAFDENISSFYRLDYDGFELVFVVESKEDPAYERLAALKDQFQNRTRAFNVRVLVAGVAASGSQKLHNLLYGCQTAQKDVEIFAFADSDACIRSDWLGLLVYPLRKENHGVSTGYRWYIPLKNNLPTLALSAMNAKVAQLLGPTVFNCAWGGSMAVRVDTFKKLGMDKIWRNAISDDLTLTREVKKSKRRVIFVPGCLVASYEQTNWPSLLEFARRQFVITRVTVPSTWWFGFVISAFSVFGLWGFAGLAVYSYLTGSQYRQVFLAAAIIFFAGQLIRAFWRQKMISEIFSADWPRMKIAAMADIIAFPLWSLILFIFIISSSFGRTIKWRGVRYKLTGPTEVIRL